MEKTMYVLVNMAGERLYQYPPTEYIDVVERYKRDWYSTHTTGARIKTIQTKNNEAL